MKPSCAKCTDTGYTGSDCTTPICFGKTGVNACSGKGQCVGPDQCECIQEGYTSDCSIPICYGKNASDLEVCGGTGITLG